MDRTAIRGIDMIEAAALLTTRPGSTGEGSSTPSHRAPDCAARSLSADSVVRPAPTSARRISLGSLILVFLVVVLPVAAGAQEAMGNRESRSSDCDSFAGVFRSLGRFSSDLPVGAQIPGRRPGQNDSENYRFLGRDLLHCYPDCSLRTDSRKTSFALSYRDGLLRWATIDSPSGTILYRGELPMDCQDGVLYDDWSEWVPPFSHPTQTFGKMKEKTFVIINTEGWLVSYEKRSVRGAVFGVLPAFGSSTGAWMEFPPDLGHQDDVARFFDGVADEVDEAAREAVLAPDLPSRSTPLNDSVSEGDPLTIGDLTLRLKEVELLRRPDDLYDATAILEAQRDRQFETVHLTRKPTGGEIVYVPVLDRQIGLTGVVDERSRQSAYIEILPVEDEGRSNSIRNAVRDVFEIGWSGGALGVVLTAKSSDVELLDDGTARTSVTLEVIRVGVGNSSLTLHRDRGAPREFVRFYDREIALEEVDDRFDPSHVVVWVRHAVAGEPDSRSDERMQPSGN